MNNNELLNDAGILTYFLARNEVIWKGLMITQKKGDVFLSELYAAGYIVVPESIKIAEDGSTYWMMLHRVAPQQESFKRVAI